MSDILSQEEIEALLSSLSDGGSADASGEGGASGAAGKIESAAAKLKQGRKGGRSAVAYEVYDFRRPDKFSKEQLRTLQMLHETFGRLAGTSLSALLRTNVSIDLISLEQVPYEEYLRSISSSVFTVMSIPPLTGQAALEMEFGLVFSMLDKLLGGPGRIVERNTLTDIEIPLFNQLNDRLFSALKTSWEGVVIVNPSVEEIETSAQFVQIAPPSDIVVSILFEVKVGEMHGAMSLCIPYMVLKPITAKLSAQKWFAATGNRRQTNTHRSAIVTQLQGTDVDVWIRMGRSKINVQDFLLLRQGDVIRLDQKTEADMTLMVADKEKFVGKPSLNGRRIAFHVNDIYLKD
ncbi:flagellar motor switch protein FliM [Kamptonema cortianum]|nr:flagellar motor switch protein FliM [Geitlerinema splendidum]MDK3158728.1 flagellar motor switch protein FliM [Kamptonema cortianum]